MKVTCVLVVVFAVFQASALSVDGGFDCGGLNINGECGTGLPTSPITSPVIDALQYRLLEALTKQTIDSAKAAIKPQIRKELLSISPLKRFSQPYSSARNIELPGLQFLPSSGITSGLLNDAHQIERLGSGIFPAVRQGSVNFERAIGSVLGGGSYPEVLNESFLGNSNGGLPGIGSSLLGNGGFLEGSRSLLSGASAVERGIVNGFTNPGY